MTRDLSTALTAARKIRERFFPSARAFLLAGSFVREEATAYSDLDLIVILERVKAAERRSFRFEGWPVEAFIHDVQTLEYFFTEVDRPSGVPSLPGMVNDGIEIPQATECGGVIKNLARQLLEQGPVPWGQEERDNSRYAITDLVEDIRAPRNVHELYPAVAGLYTAIATHYCRSQTQWAAKGKSIPGRLFTLDPAFHRRFTDAFDAAYTQHDTSAVIRLAEEVLAPDGGFLFDGYTRTAPHAWRLSAP